MKSCTELLEPVRELGIEAGKKILNIYETEFSVEHKDDKSPLTEADMAAHHTIVEGLLALTPELPVLSEESANIPFGERSQWQTYWLVDPLDGTREFVKRNGEFTVNIALIQDHEPVLGVIYAPVLDITYFACRDHGAWKQQGVEEPSSIHIRSFPTSTPIVAGSRSHRGDSLKGFLDRLGEHELIGMGSSLKSCLVAEGAADVYPRFGPTSEWDTAAAQSIVEEAGGKLTGINLLPLRYNTKESLLNPDFIVIGDTNYNWSSLLG